MGIKEVRNELTYQSLVTLSRAARVSEFHGGIIVPQDIAAVLAATTFRPAFGNRIDSRKAVVSFIDWAHYESTSRTSRLSLDHGTILNADARLTLDARDLIARAHNRALSDNRAKANDLDLLNTMLGVGGGEVVEPLSFMIGDRSSAILYREAIFARANNLRPFGYGSSYEHELAQQAIAHNLQQRRAA